MSSLEALSWGIEQVHAPHAYTTVLIMYEYGLWDLVGGTGRELKIFLGVDLC